MADNEPISEDDFIKLKQGNSLAYRKVFDNYYGFVQFIVKRCGIGNGDVADIVQEVFFRLYLNRESLSHQSVLKTWLATSARNLCIDHLRKYSRLSSLQDEPGQEQLAQGAENLTRELEILLIGDLLVKISKETGDSSAAEFYTQGLSAKQIAEKNSEPLSSVTNRLSRFRKKFKDRLKQHIEELRATTP